MPIPKSDAVTALEERLAELDKAGHTIKALAETEKRNLSDEERKALASNITAYQALEEELAQCRCIEERTWRRVHPEGDPDNPPANPPVERSTPGAGTAATIAQHGDIRVTDRGADDPKLGWRTCGEYFQSVIKADKRGGHDDKRLARAALATYGSEGVGADGGFAVPPAFLNRIVEKIQAESSLLEKVDKLTTASSSLTIPKDEATPWGTAGPQAYWTGEAAAATQSKPAVENSTVPVHTLTVLVPLTEQLMEDAPALEAYTTRRTGIVMGHKVDLAIYQGTGAGQPLGMLGAGCTIAVAKEGSQTADTLVAENVKKMWTRLYGDFRAGAVWLVNQDCEVQLMGMYGIDAESTPLTTWPVYLPQGGFSASPFATLFGRPVIYTQVCETLGDKGDIMLCNLQHYLGVQKAAGIKMETSIHFWFDQNTTAFRASFRFGGQPWWNTTIAARDGTQTYSPFVTLAERA